MGNDDSVTVYNSREGIRHGGRFFGGLLPQIGIFLRASQVLWLLRSNVNTQGPISVRKVTPHLTAMVDCYSAVG